ncbi:MAG: cytochrome c oxidase assembly protein [Chloroflexota bacterium]|nr:cytochrome c oxidase assembly protein [Chloroflexota bacterium]
MDAPSTSALLTQWSWEPSVVIGLLLFASAYAYAVGPLRRRHSLGPPASQTQIVLFALSELTLIIALLSPIDAIGDSYLFSVHMVQHLLLAAVWPVVFLLSIPAWLARYLFRPGFFGELMEFLTVPMVAITLFNIDIVAWHVPALYDLTLRNEWVHVSEHLSFMVFGFFNFWPILSPMRERRLAYPFQVLYLFADGMFMMVLGILFTFAPIIFYGPYAAAPRLWSISALSDQQLGGLIMWYPGNLPYGVLLVVAFYRWFDGDELVSPEPPNISAQSHTIGPPLG